MFTIIQTFFVSAISGGLLEEIKAIFSEPLSSIDLLANTLPAQSTYFMQICFVGTVVFLALENLRAIPLATAFIRRFVGPKRTKRQRQKSLLWIRPLADPYDFEHASNMAQITVLYFVVLLVSFFSSVPGDWCSGVEKFHILRVFYVEFTPGVPDNRSIDIVRPWVLLSHYATGVSPPVHLHIPNFP